MHPEKDFHFTFIFIYVICLVLADNGRKLLKVENLVFLCQHLKNYCIQNVSQSVYKQKRICICNKIERISLLLSEKKNSFKSESFKRITVTTTINCKIVILVV